MPAAPHAGMTAIVSIVPRRRGCRIKPAITQMTAVNPIALSAAITPSCKSCISPPLSRQLMKNRRKGCETAYKTFFKYCPV